MVRHRRTRWPAAAVLLSAACGVFASAPVRAQQPPEQRDPDGDVERARALFARGLEHADAGEWEQAQKQFRAALELKRAPAVEYNLASALVQLEEYRAAETHLDRVLADPETDDAIRELAEELREQMREEAAKVTVMLSGDATDVNVTLDDEPLAPERVGSPVMVAPGMHTAVAARDGRELDRERLEARAGQGAVARLDVGDARLDAIDATAAAQSEQDDTLVKDWRLWAGVGAGLVLITAVAVGVAVGGGGTQSPVEGDFEPGVLTWR